MSALLPLRLKHILKMQTHLRPRIILLYVRRLTIKIIWMILSLIFHLEMNQIMVCLTSLTPHFYLLCLGLILFAELQDPRASKSFDLGETAGSSGPTQMKAGDATSDFGQSPGSGAPLVNQLIEDPSINCRFIMPSFISSL